MERNTYTRMYTVYERVEARANTWKVFAESYLCQYDLSDGPTHSGSRPHARRGWTHAEAQRTEAVAAV